MVANISQFLCYIHFIGGKRQQHNRWNDRSWLNSNSPRSFCVPFGQLSRKLRDIVFVLLFFFAFFAMKKNSKAVYNAYWFHIIEPPRILFLRIFSGTFFSFFAFSYSVARGVTILFEQADIRTDINMTWIYMSRNSLNAIWYAWKMARGIILAESAVRNCLK